MRDHTIVPIHTWAHTIVPTLACAQTRMSLKFAHTVLEKLEWSLVIIIYATKNCHRISWNNHVSNQLGPELINFALDKFQIFHRPLTDSQTTSSYFERLSAWALKMLI